MREKRKKLDSFKLTELIVLIALAIVLQILSSFGLPELAICIVPVTIGAIMLGLEGGLALGLAFGIASLVGGLIGNNTLEAQLFDQNWILASVVFMVKSVGTGVLTAIIHKGLVKINRYLAVIFASIAAPLVNTAILLMGSAFFMDSLEVLAEKSELTIGKYITNGILFGRSLPELIINVLLTILIVKLLILLRGEYKRRKRKLKRNDKYSVIFFDLDGTVADSGKGVTNSVIYALEKFGMSETVENTKRFIGPPLAHSFKEFYGFDDEKAALAIRYYREYYKDKGIYECHIYDGMRDLLSGLKKRGYKVVLCTSKPENYAHRVLEFLEIDKYFDIICGATMDEKTRTTKEDVMAYALMSAHATPSTTLMIGDRHFDICSANYFGLDSVGVTFGYGSLNELKNAGATYVADSCEEIKRILY